MSVIKKMRRQKAVYWERLAADAYGRYGFAEPVEIDCRWDDLSSEFRDAQGEKQLSRATVYPDRVMLRGDMLMRGELDGDTPVDPRENTDAFEIEAFAQIPNFRATETLYVAYLK